MRDLVPFAPRVRDELEERGVPVRAALAEAGLDPAAQAVTTAQFFALWSAVERIARRPDLGLVLGADAPDGGYSVAVDAALRAPDLATALVTFGRYKRLTCPEQVVLERDGDEASVRFHWVLATSNVPPLLVDSTFASFVAVARRGTAGAVVPRRIDLARKSADGSLLRAHFGCPVVFRAAVDRIVFEASALAVPFVTADAAAFGRMVPDLERELAQSGDGGALLGDVRVAIARTLGHGARPSVEAIAKRLSMSPRTLQRRLGEERTTYQEQLDDVRRTSARRLLANTELEPTDIAFLLGFEEPNSFVRAFRSWEDTTPLRFRARVAGA